jgi:hypothetical protein
MATNTDAFFQDVAYNVVDAHHKRNRYPPAPDSDRLDAIRKSYTNKSHLEDSASESGSDSESTEMESDIDDRSESESGSDGEGIGTPPRSKHCSGKTKGGRARAPRNSKGQRRVRFTQLQAYPSQWRSILEDAKKCNRCTTAIKAGFLQR